MSSSPVGLRESSPVLPHAFPHGGNMLAAARRWRCDVADILDLSTGLHPAGAPAWLPAWFPARRTSSTSRDRPATWIPWPIRTPIWPAMRPPNSFARFSASLKLNRVAGTGARARICMTWKKW